MATVYQDGVRGNGGAYRAPPLQTHGSTLVESVLEYRWLGDVTAELLRRGIEFEILRGDIDRRGDDLIIEAAGVIRHVQLKATMLAGARSSITVNRRLADRPSGCVVWMRYDPAEFRPVSFRWFGGAPGQPLPHPGGRVARHSRANALGLKPERPGHRIISAGAFRRVGSIAQLVDLMFGPVPTASDDAGGRDA